MNTQIKERFTINPEKLFLTDSLGALLSAFFLFVVLKSFDEYFGMPKNVLNYLSAIALVFSVYSFACFYFLKKNWKVFLGIIVSANLLYTLLTLSLVFYHLKSLTLLGILYFVVEMIVVIALVSIEIRTLRSWQMPVRAPQKWKRLTGWPWKSWRNTIIGGGNFGCKRTHRAIKKHIVSEWRLEANPREWRRLWVFQGIFCLFFPIQL